MIHRLVKSSALRVGLLLCIVSMQPLFAQKTSLYDSLVTILGQTSEGETKLELYQRLCSYYTDISPNLTLAKNYVDSIASLAKKMDSDRWIYESQLLYGIIAYHQRKNDEATQYLQSYVDHLKSQGDSARVARGLFYIAALNADLGNFETSLATFYRVLAIAEGAGEAKKMATTLNSIGTVYKQLDKLPDAINAYHQSGKTFKAAGLKIDYAISLQNIANIFITQEKYDSAKQYYDEALLIFREYKHLPFEATVLGNMGNLYEAQDDYTTALSYHQQALAIWRKNVRKGSLANCLDNIGKSNLKLGRYKEADKYLREALPLAREVKRMPLVQDIYANFSTLYVETKDFEKAYRYHLLSSQVKDSLFNEENAKQINELQAKYENAKKDKQIVVLAKENELQEKETQRQATANRVLAGGLAFILVLGGLAYYIFRQRTLLTSKSNEVKEADFKRQLGELEMKALRAQINPHFLFNCMNAINLMIRKGDDDGACLYLAKFSKLVRLILENSETPSVTLESEIELLESYIMLEELRTPGKINHTITVDESVGLTQTYLPSMVLQPFVENAIWHGIAHKDNQSIGTILIHVMKEGDMLCCTIEDNGVGREQSRALRDKTLLKNKSMGIKITEERLRLISQQNRDQFIFITDLNDSHGAPAGTRVKVYIPISE